MFHTFPSSYIFDEHVVIFLFRREICIACVDLYTLEKNYNKLNLKVKKLNFSLVRMQQGSVVYVLKDNIYLIQVELA